MSISMTKSADSFCMEVSEDAVASTPIRHSSTNQSNLLDSNCKPYIPSMSIKKRLNYKQTSNISKNAEHKSRPQTSLLKKNLNIKSDTPMKTNNNNFSKSVQRLSKSLSLFNEQVNEIMEKSDFCDSNILTRSMYKKINTSDTSVKEKCVSNFKNTAQSDYNALFVNKSNCNININATLKIHKSRNNDSKNIIENISNEIATHSKAVNSDTSSKPLFVRRKLYSHLPSFTDTDSSKTNEKTFLERKSDNIYEPSKKFSKAKSNIFQENTKQKNNNLPDPSNTNSYCLRTCNKENKRYFGIDDLKNDAIYKTTTKEDTNKFLSNLLKNITDKKEDNNKNNNTIETDSLFIDNNENDNSFETLSKKSKNGNIKTTRTRKQLISAKKQTTVDNIIKETLHSTNAMKVKSNKKTNIAKQNNFNISIPLKHCKTKDNISDIKQSINENRKTKRKHTFDNDSEIIKKSKIDIHKKYTFDPKLETRKRSYYQHDNSCNIALNYSPKIPHNISYNYNDDLENIKLHRSRYFVNKMTTVHQKQINLYNALSKTQTKHMQHDQDYRNMTISFNKQLCNISKPKLYSSEVHTNTKIIIDEQYDNVFKIPNLPKKYKTITLANRQIEENKHNSLNDDNPGNSFYSSASNNDIFKTSHLMLSNYTYKPKCLFVKKSLLHCANSENLKFREKPIKSSNFSQKQLSNSKNYMFTNMPFKTNISSKNFNFSSNKISHLVGTSNEIKTCEQNLIEAPILKKYKKFRECRDSGHTYDRSFTSCDLQTFRDSNSEVRYRSVDSFNNKTYFEGKKNTNETLTSRKNIMGSTIFEKCNGLSDKYLDLANNFSGLSQTKMSKLSNSDKMQTIINHNDDNIFKSKTTSYQSQKTTTEICNDDNKSDDSWISVKRVPLPASPWRYSNSYI